MQVDAQTFCSTQIPTYLGNKRRLLPVFDMLLSAHGDKPITFLDGFSGSGIVSRHLKTKKNVTQIYSNDWEPYSTVINGCYLQNVDDSTCTSICREVTKINSNRFTEMASDDYYIYGNYTPRDDQEICMGERAFFTAMNGRIIDNIRTSIENYADIDKSYFLGPLLVQASKQNNTCGYFNSFYKCDGVAKYGGRYGHDSERICGPIELPSPIFYNNWNCKVNILSNDIMDVVPFTFADVAYFDPPYNKHPYGTYYFMLNTIAEYRKHIPLPRNQRGQHDDWKRSKFNSFVHARAEFGKLIHQTHAPEIWVSYSNRGILSSKDIKDIMQQYGKVDEHVTDHATYHKLLGQGSKFRRQPTVPAVKESFFILKRRK